MLSTLRLSFILSLVMLAPSAMVGDESNQIIRTHPQDELYSQHQQELEDWNRALANQQPLGTPVMYRYQVADSETLISLASRFTLPYSTLATINRIPRNAQLATAQEIIVPAASGLFVPLEPTSDLERLIYERRLNREELPSFIPVNVEHAGQTQQFLLLPGEDFDTLERIAFFGRLFQNPIRSGRISSAFGPRPDPFSGEPSYHFGVDFATAENQRVYAAREGTVSRIGINDPIYGNYVMVTHSGGFETLYAHMNSILVREGQRVTNSSVLGGVGSTGHSTGPHVHFEVHHYGRIIDPAVYLRTLDLIQYAEGSEEQPPAR